MTATIASKISGHYDVLQIADGHVNALNHRVIEVDHEVPNEDGTMDKTGHVDLTCLDCTVVTETNGNYTTEFSTHKHRIVEDAESQMFRLQTADIEGSWTPGMAFQNGYDARNAYFSLF
jgi:hypothetical protein